MGCAGIKIAKQSEIKKFVDVPDFKFKKTRNSSNSISPSDLLIFNTDIKISITPDKIPLLNIEVNALRNRRIMNISRNMLSDGLKS